MNARVETPESAFALGQVPPWDQELERNILGLAMLGRPMPAWLEPDMFYPSQHIRIYEAVQSVGGHVAKVNAWLRDSADKFKPPIAWAHELAAMCLEAEQADQMGWDPDFTQLRELARQRELIACMARVAIRLRHGDLSHKEARRVLSDHFGEHK